MIIDKSSILKFIGGALVGGLIMYFLLKEETQVVDVPVSIDVTTPEIVKQTDTVYLPKPVYEFIEGESIIDSTYYDKYTQLKDSLAKEELFKEAIAIKTYKEVIEDDTLKIDLYAKTRGTLLEYQVDYKIKPFTFTVDTTLSIPVPKKTKFFFGGEVGLPANNVIDMKPTIKPGVLMVNKKDSRVYKLGYDFVNKSFEGGIFIRL